MCDKQVDLRQGWREAWRHYGGVCSLGLLLVAASLALAACQPVRAVQAAGAAGRATPPRTEQEKANQALVQRFYDKVFTQKNMAALNDLFATDFVPHDLDAQELPAGIDGTIAAFPDLKTTVTQWVIEGDMITAMVTFTGTQTGDFLGVAPTGKSVTFSIIDIWRVQDGKIAELWHDVPNNEILAQIGGPAAGASTGQAAASQP